MANTNDILNAMNASRRATTKPENTTNLNESSKAKEKQATQDMAEIMQACLNIGTPSKKNNPGR